MKLTGFKHKQAFLLQKITLIFRSTDSKGKALSLTSALDGGGWSTPRPGRFTPLERPGTHCTRGWVGPRAGLDRCGKSRPPHRDSIPEPKRQYLPHVLSDVVYIRYKKKISTIILLTNCEFRGNRWSRSHVII